jgi:hypothetical protein
VGTSSAVYAPNAGPPTQPERNQEPTPQRLTRAGLPRAVPLALAGVFLVVVLSLLRWNAPGIHAYPDTTWYVRNALFMRGWDQADADHEAAVVRCSYWVQPALSFAKQAECVQDADDLLHSPPRYEDIFAARPGYPIILAPLSALLGSQGFVVATLMVAVVDGILIMILVRLLGGTSAEQLVASGAFLLLPSGFWSTRLLSDGTMLAGLLVTVCGAILLQRGTRRAGVGLILAGLGAVFVTKSANLLGLGLALFASGAAIAWVARGSAKRSGYLLAAVAITALLLAAASSIPLGWPGFGTSVQDMLTDHFIRPDVPDPWSSLARANLQFWPDVLGQWLHSPVLVLGSLAALVWLAVRLRMASIPVLLAGLSGIPLLVVHPVVTEWDRLLVPIWVPVAVAIGLALPAFVAGRLDFVSSQLRQLSSSRRLRER